MPRTSNDVRIRIIDQSFQTARTAIRWGAGVLFAYFALKAIDSLAGQNTSVLVQATFKILTDIRLAIPYALATGLGVWAFGERKLRQRKTASLQGRIRELELTVDPKRTSSNLTVHGKTNPKDRRV